MQQNVSQASKPPFSKILIANRGEIAVRIIRACRELGIESVAVYSEADIQALHVRMANQGVLIGPPAPGESYLDARKLIAAALQTGAEAIHPGYGFLSENAAFAQAVLEAGLVFIGPTAQAIDAMGDKGQARSLMIAAGVPVVPGYQGPDDDAQLAQAAAEIGYPVFIKAAAGGGGKGMRVVSQPEDLPEMIAAARREAIHAFGDPRLILEKYIPDARHVEIQVLGDMHGNVVHLFERECSIQRRHQKIIEETPSPLLNPALRKKMGASAVAAATAVHYIGAGTIEFIVDPTTLKYYFLEMNTRLQVEHPITEKVTNLDLVHLQLRVAAGEALPFTQADLHQTGHALECRLYAEDPSNQFLPSAGKILEFIPPQGPGVRVDSGVTTGDTITTHYDPLIAKVITFAEDRPTAIRKMRAALQETILLGLTSNLAFLQAVLEHPVFWEGTATTQFVPNHMSSWRPTEDELPFEALAAAILADFEPPAARSGSPGRDLPGSPWQRVDRFRLGES